jgi:hypothetical protein
MTILLAHIALPAGLRWIDEFDDQAVTQSVRRRLDGGLTIYPRGNVAGRPITLEATEDQWLTRTQAEGLAGLASAPGMILALSLRGVGYSVLFRHQDPPALELRALVDYADPRADDPVIGRIKLMTI